MKAPKIVITLLLTLSNLFFLFGQDLTLNIVGKDSIETKIVGSIEKLNSFSDYKSIQQEIDSVLIKLQKKGFIESELVELTKNNDSTFSANIHLNRKFDTIYIYHKNMVPKDILLNIDKNTNDDYLKAPIFTSENTLKLINEKLSESGDPFVTLQLDNIRKKDLSNLAADLKIASTKQRVINKIIVKGHDKFPESYLKRFLKIKTGQTFNLKSIKQKTKDLDNLPFTTQIREPEILFTKDSTTLYLYLEKRQNNSFDGFLGFGNNETTNKIKFNGYLNLNLINNLNYGESVKFIYKSDENEQRTIDINAKLPYIFKSPVGLELGLNIFKKDSTFNTVNQSAKLFYQINSRMKIYSGIETSNSSNLLDNSLSSEIGDYKSTFYSFSFEYENITNNRLFPVKSYLLAESNFGSRKLDNTSIGQTALSYKAFKIFNLNDKNSIYLNSEGKMLISDSYLTNELYRFGGINSARGFEENSLFASLYSVINSEYRYLINNNLYVNSIIDAAYYEDDINSLKEKLFGFGLGLGILTNAGILKINYANGLTKNQPFKFNNSKIHISLTANF